MKTTADIAWPGGKAKAEDSVDPLTIPALTRARWLADGILVPEGGEEEVLWATQPDHVFSDSIAARNEEGDG